MRITEGDCRRLSNQVNEKQEEFVLPRTTGSFWRAELADFDSAIPRFESWRPSQLLSV